MRAPGLDGRNELVAPTGFDPPGARNSACDGLRTKRQACTIKPSARDSEADVARRAAPDKIVSVDEVKHAERGF